MQLVICILPFWDDIFNITLSILNIDYNPGIETRFLVIVGVLSLLFAAWQYVRITRKILRKELLFFFCLVLFPAMYLITGYIYSNNMFDLMDSIQKAVLRSSILFFSFYTIDRKQLHAKFCNTAIPLACILSALSFLSLLPQLSGSRVAIQVGALRYQKFGYTCARYILLLFFALQQKLIDQKHKKFIWVTLLLDLLILIFSGARGAVVSAALGVLVFFIVIQPNRLFIQIAKYALIVAASTSVFLWLGNRFQQFSGIVSSFNRLFNYISSGGVDLTNRQSIYSRAIAQIQSVFPLGDGIGSSYYTIGYYPHNLFFEWLLEGGILYFLLMLLLLIVSLKNWIFAARQNAHYLLVFSLCTVQIVQLFFSGSYFMEGYFWLLVFYAPSKRTSLQTSGFTKDGGLSNLQKDFQFFH